MRFDQNCSITPNRPHKALLPLHKRITMRRFCPRREYYDEQTDQQLHRSLASRIALPRDIRKTSDLATRRDLELCTRGAFIPSFACMRQPTRFGIRPVARTPDDVGEYFLRRDDPLSRTRVRFTSTAINTSDRRHTGNISLLPLTGLGGVIDFPRAIHSRGSSTSNVDDERDSQHGVRRRLCSYFFFFFPIPRVLHGFVLDRVRHRRTL